MENVCRTCLKTTGELVPLFTRSNLPNKIAAISSVSVLETDGLPTRICSVCAIRIDLFYYFRAGIINADAELKKRAQSLIAANIEKENAVILQNLKAEISDSEVGITDDFEPQREEIESSVPLEKPGTVIAKLSKSANVAPAKEKVYRYGCKYKCEACGFSCVTSNEFHKHKRKHFANKTVCNICGKSVRTDNIHKHIIYHSVSPSPCNICGKVMKNSESLRYHLMGHRRPRTTCEFCGQTFKYHNAFKQHIERVHGGAKNVKCTICDKMFYEIRDLKKHLRSHTGERPYPCKYCKKGFSSSHALKTHIRRHTNEKPYVCELCPAAFPQKVSLRTHMKSKHPNQEKTD